MFERRLKLLLVVLSVVVVALLARAAQLQIVQRAYWSREASDALKTTHYLETTRGAIVDRQGRELAVDRPCMDACVDYRAMAPKADPEWCRQIALDRLKARLGDAWTPTPRKKRTELLASEMRSVQSDIDAMWDKLAELSDRPREEIEQIRQDIIKRVEFEKRFVWFTSYNQAIGKQGGAPDAGPQWEKWLSGESDDGPEIDKFAVTVGDEKAHHVVLHAISRDVQNELGRYIDKYPGLKLRPGTHRYYPYEDVACHVLGRLGRVNSREIKADPHHDDRRRRYMPNDDIGRAGLEWLCEPALRGTLGRVISSADGSSTSDPPVSGETVRTSIDIDLQQEIQAFFASASLRGPRGDVIERGAILHGAAVLLDVKTNQVLALVSYPTYDVNRFDELYARLYDDDLNDPLRDRATESVFEPGSTVKPLVGLGAITSGIIKVNEGIECTGNLVLPDHEHHDRPQKLPWGRCWVASMYDELLHHAVAHHPVPYDAPHRGHDGNLDGYLTYSDGLERSCNVYFETVADRMGVDLLTDWMRRFGLGHRTGIGIEEARGRVPGNAPRLPGWAGRATGFLAGIGQGYVGATPIQMANVVAAIARGGIWMRPRLLMPDPQSGNWPATRPSMTDVPDAVDLHLDPRALAACKLGMINVVNGAAGTGKGARMDGLLVAGKTGTAQAAPFRRALRDPKTGKPILNARGRRQFEDQAMVPSTPDHPNPEAPWYRGGQSGKPDHAWMIGFVPAENPKIAFAVLVEYGGSGGAAAADVVRASLETCIAHGYLQRSGPGPQLPTVATR